MAGSTLYRPRYLIVGDKRSPRLRLLQDGQGGHPGHLEVAYDQQWRTLWKAQRLGYLDRDANLTEKGYAYLTQEAP